MFASVLPRFAVFSNPPFFKITQECYKLYYVARKRFHTAPRIVIFEFQIPTFVSTYFHYLPFKSIKQVDRKFHKIGKLQISFTRDHGVPVFLFPSMCFDEKCISSCFLDCIRGETGLMSSQFPSRDLPQFHYVYVREPLTISSYE